MGEILTLGYCLRTIGHCFPIVFWMEENKVMMGRFPHSLYYGKPCLLSCIFENVCQTSVVMSHKCICMAFVIDVLFSISDSRSLTFQKELKQ